jgi:hypothetical protein
VHHGTIIRGDSTKSGHVFIYCFTILVTTCSAWTIQNLFQEVYRVLKCIVLFSYFESRATKSLFSTDFVAKTKGKQKKLEKREIDSGVGEVQVRWIIDLEETCQSIQNSQLVGAVNICLTRKDRLWLPNCTLLAVTETSRQETGTGLIDILFPGNQERCL